MTWQEWQQQNIRALLWVMDARVARVEQTLQSLTAMARLLLKDEASLMLSIADVKAAEMAEGDKIDGLVTLANSIFDKLSAVPDPSPAVQEVLDMIAAHNAGIDAAVARDTSAAPAAG